MIRVVFDTNIVYSAIRKSEGLPAKAVDLVVSGQIIPCVSDALLDEYRDVLFRPKLDLHSERRRPVLDIFSTLSLHVTPTVTLKISSDDDDNRPAGDMGVTKGNGCIVSLCVGQRKDPCFNLNNG